MVLLIIIPFLNGYFIGNINPTFSDIPLFVNDMIYAFGFSWSCKPRNPAPQHPPGHCEPDLAKGQDGDGPMLSTGYGMDPMDPMDAVYPELVLKAGFSMGRSGS